MKSSFGPHIHPTNLPYPDSQHPDSHVFAWDKGRNLKEYQILYIYKGAGLFETDGLPERRIEAGTVILLYPGVWHRYKPIENTGWEEYWIGFSGSYTQYLLEQECFNPQNPIIQIGFNEEFLAAFERLLEVVENRDAAHQKLASFLLIQLLGIIYTSVLYANRHISRKERVIAEVKKGINEIWYQNIDFEHLADQFNVSYAWLRKAFKEQTGTSLNQYHLGLKLRKAESMIHGSNHSLAEISALCGFESVHYFSRIFKQKTGLNPSTFRLQRLK